jgi:hypothetical protein
VRFNPVSKQDNYQDIICGIQENKNQFNGADVAKQFTRLVAFVKKMKVREIKHFFESRLAAHRAVEVEEEEQEEEEQEEEEEEEEAEPQAVQAQQPQAVQAEAVVQPQAAQAVQAEAVVQPQAAQAPPFVEIQEPEEELGQELGAAPYEEEDAPVPASVVLDIARTILGGREVQDKEHLQYLLHLVADTVFP